GSDPLPRVLDLVIEPDLPLGLVHVAEALARRHLPAFANLADAILRDALDVAVLGRHHDKLAPTVAGLRHHAAPAAAIWNLLLLAADERPIAFSELKEPAEDEGWPAELSHGLLNPRQLVQPVLRHRGRRRHGRRHHGR